MCLGAEMTSKQIKEEVRKRVGKSKIDKILQKLAKEVMKYNYLRG